MRNTSPRRPAAALATAIAALGVLALLPVAGAQSPVDPATLVLRGGRIVTMDDAAPEAQAVAVRGDTIVAVGTDEEIARYVGPRPASSTSRPARDARLHRRPRPLHGHRPGEDGST